MKDKISVKVSDSGREFLENLSVNRRYLKVDKKQLCYHESIDIIAKFFKLNQDKYHELIQLEK